MQSKLAAAMLACGPAPGRKVFIVHGHSKTEKKDLRTFLRELTCGLSSCMSRTTWA